jgi:hypothetical protein
VGRDLGFRPLDFIQVNADLNQKMIERTFELLDPQPRDRVLDLSAASATSPCRWPAARAKRSASKARPDWCCAHARTRRATAWATRSSTPRT